MIQFGPWHPDKAGINVPVCVSAVNCVPGVNGFRPLPGLADASGAVGTDFITDDAGQYITDEGNAYISADATVTDYVLDQDGNYITDDLGSNIETESRLTGLSCYGAAVVFDDDGDVFTFAGGSNALFKLDASSNWIDVSRTSGGNYSTGSGERWQFGFAGGLVIAVTIAVEPQKYLLNTSDNFTALGGVPPRARYIATVGEFVVLGGLASDERTVHWSGLANAEHWTPGTQSCDIQTFQNGGPIRGLVGGEVGYVFQAETVTRMTFVPGSEAIFQFDQVEGGRGLAAPYSLVKLGNEAFYLAADGFYKFSLGGGASSPLGVGKWASWFVGDIKAGTEPIVLGGVDPVGRRIVWAYNSRDNTGTTPNRLLIYDWALDEATIADVSVIALGQVLTQGVTLDTMNLYGNLDTLPFSLDSPVWRGGASLLAVFGDDSTMSFFTGPAMEATFVTADGGQGSRFVLKGVRPHVDTRSVTIEIAAREAEGDTLSYGPSEGMADTGVVPAWASGFLARARVTVAEGAVWTKITGMTDILGGVGKR